MTALAEFDGMIAAITRLRNSVNGNPVHRVALLGEMGWTFNTEPDASVGYDLCNRSEWLTRRVRVTLNERGRIIGVRPLDAEDGR